MHNHKPSVSILLPVCNAEAHLRECLDSLLRQSYTDFEIIAVEDKSKDSSLKILREYARKDKRIRVHANIKRYGLAVCLNRALKHVKGQYVMLTEANDRSHVHRIKRQVEYLQVNQKTVAVGCQCRFISTTGRELDKSEFPSEHDAISTSLIPGSSLQYETVMINTRILPKDFLAFTETKYPYLYADALMKLLPYGSIANLEQYLYYRRDLPVKRSNKQPSRATHYTSLMRLWVRSIALYEYRPPIRSFFSPART